MEGHHLVEETRGQVAVLRGPVVYCIESQDIGQGVEIADLAVPRSVQLRPVAHTIGNLPVTALEGDLLKYEHRDWGNSLYREVSSVARTIHVSGTEESAPRAPRLAVISTSSSPLPSFLITLQVVVFLARVSQWRFVPSRANGMKSFASR